MRIDQQAGAAHLNLIECAVVAAIDGLQEAVIGRGFHFADAVVIEALGIIADAIWEARFISVGDFVGEAACAVRPARR